MGRFVFTPAVYRAPGFLPAEALAEPTLHYGMYRILAGAIVVLLGALLYLKVLRAPDGAERQPSRGEDPSSSRD